LRAADAAAAPADESAAAAALHEQNKVARRVNPDDAAAALHEQKKVASREADAARRRQSRAADATATLKCVWRGLCAPLPSLQMTRRPH